MSFQEAEVTKSLYSNLYKAGWVMVNGDTRMIDSNERVNSRIKEAFRERNLQEGISDEEGDGFTAGLHAEEVEDLLDPDSEGVLFKNMSRQEQEEIYRQLEEAKAELEQTRNEAERMMAEAESQIESMRAEAFEEARTKGYQDGYNSGMAQVQTMKDEWSAKRTQLEAEYQQMVEELEPAFVETLRDVYEHIFNVDLGIYGGLVTNLVMDTMLRAGNASNYIVHVSKQDYPQVIKEKERILEGTGTLAERLEIISDMTLAPSGCMIETENGVYDCSLGTELEELGRRLRLLSYNKQ